MKTIRECMNDNTELINGRGYIIRNIYDVDIVHIDKQTILCQNCKCRIKTDHDFDYCRKCSTFDESHTFGKIERRCKQGPFNIQKKKKIKYENADVAKIYKIKIDHICGIMLCVIYFEENDWSSTPCNYYKTTFYLFRNPKNRNIYFDQHFSYK